MRPRAPWPAFLALVWLAAPAAASAGDVEGRLSLAVEGAGVAQLGPLVVYLESREGASAARVAAVAEVRQRAVRFQPDFLVVAVGQPVAMPNDDSIFHNVFSMSRPNDFDLGTYPAGHSKTVRFDHPGLVRIYCSIHEGMSGGIFVAPSPWFDTASTSGRFRIRNVPAGSYRLTVWNERLPGATRTLSVPAGGSARIDLEIGAPAP